jgi:hypothetical protein
MAIPIWESMFKKRKPFGAKSASGSYYFPSRPSMSGLPALGNRPGFNAAGVSPIVSPEKKGFFGKMSPEELKDFKETMAEMDFGVDQEFLAGGNFGRTQEYGALPYSFDESSMSEMQKRKKLFPFLA